VVFTSVLLLTVNTRTSTPRLTARSSARRKSSSGTKYEFSMYSVFRAPLIVRARNRSAGVLPAVGAANNSPACVGPTA
jgi:hypothetical protein